MLKKVFTLASWSLGLNDPFVAGEKSLGKHSYLKHLAKFNKTWVIIDAGAHIGSFTDRASKHLNISKAIFIEPNIEHQETLLDKKYHSVCLVKALSTNNLTKFYTRNTKNSGQNFTSSRIKSNEKVECITINSVFSRYKILNNEVYFLKLDIEGNELDILRSINIDYLNKIKAISVEIHHEINTINVIDKINEILPNYFEVFRETRYGMIKLSRLKPHWTDQLNLFQNLIIINQRI